MQLLFNDASPYARKCAVVAREKGLENQITIERLNVYESEFRDQNPLNKIPCLIRQEGPALFDSFVICDYLDRIGYGPKLIPAEGDARDRVLRLHAIGQGMTDAALNLRSQVMRDAKLDTPLPKDWYIDRQWTAITKSCITLNEEVTDFGSQTDIGQISIGTALGYLDLRFPGAAWRHHGPALADWFKVFSAHPSMQETQPRG